MRHSTGLFNIAGWNVWNHGWFVVTITIPIGSMYGICMVTFAIYIPQMLAYIPIYHTWILWDLWWFFYRFQNGDIFHVAALNFRTGISSLCNFHMENNGLGHFPRLNSENNVFHMFDMILRWFKLIVLWDVEMLMDFLTGAKQIGNSRFHDPFQSISHTYCHDNPSHPATQQPIQPRCLRDGHWSNDDLGDHQRKPAKKRCGAKGMKVGKQQAKNGGTYAGTYH